MPLYATGTWDAAWLAMQPYATKMQPRYVAGTWAVHPPKAAARLARGTVLCTMAAMQRYAVMRQRSAAFCTKGRNAPGTWAGAMHYGCYAPAVHPYAAGTWGSRHAALHRCVAPPCGLVPGWYAGKCCAPYGPLSLGRPCVTTERCHNKDSRCPKKT